MNLFNEFSDKTNRLLSEHQQMIEQRLESWIKSETKIRSGIADKVIDYFTLAKRRKNSNQVSIKQTKTRKKLIESLVMDGYEFQDFKNVIDYMIEKWFNDIKMSQYLTPDTIFRPSNFPKYHEEALSIMISTDTPHEPLGNQYDHLLS